MNRFLLALSFLALTSGLAHAATSGQYKNADGSFTSSTVQLCPNPDGTNTTVSCSGAESVGLTDTAGTPISPATTGRQDTGNTSLASILAKLSADPSTQTTLAAVLAKISADPATQTTLAAVLAKLTADPSTATLQISTNTKLDTLHTDATSPTPLPPGFSFAHISTATTTAVKSGAGVLHTLSVNNLGTVASTTTVYDNTAGSGTAIAVINTLAGQTSYIYDVAFATGLTIVTTGTVAPDVTVSYR